MDDLRRGGCPAGVVTEEARGAVIGTETVATVADRAMVVAAAAAGDETGGTLGWEVGPTLVAPVT